ncbi:methionine synthase [Desulfitobacterium sp.]|uniref:methionine synthase n=1 Tax=Desulfitobacterium sp. TaxID=49981 RepID=UPI002C728E09|nr:methionine synthase [Desulfitobacterium sp.]HVJ48178.1 methionine synthase [Desulfitobacterium sp.]
MVRKEENKSSDLNPKTWEPHFLATGIGSLPHSDPEAALDLIWQSVPTAPHWPQLPNLGAESSFIGQFLRPLIETGVIGGFASPRFQVEAPDWPERMARFYELYLRAESGEIEALDAFGFTPKGGIGFESFCADIEHRDTQGVLLVKGQLSGPLTVGMQITDANRRASYYDEIQRDLLVKALAMHGEWQTRRLARFGYPVLISIDEPELYAYGASTHVTLGRESLIAHINEISDGILRQGGIPGVHVCAGTDWTLLFDSKVRVVNFDAYEYMTSMIVLAESLNDFLEQGGILSWGIVPTSAKAFGETVESLQECLEGNIQELVKRGVNEARLRAQSILTPSCGIGTLELDLTERIYALLQGLALKMS